MLARTSYVWTSAPGVNVNVTAGSIALDLEVVRMNWITSGDIWRDEYPILYVKDGQLIVADIKVAEV